MNIPYKKTITAIVSGLLGIGGTAAVTTDALDFIHTHDDLAASDHTHVQPVAPQLSLEGLDSVETLIDGELHSCVKL